MRRRFFVERFEGHRATLTGQTAEHLGRVLRAEPGQLYELSDGQRVFLARVERIALAKRGEPRIEFFLVEPIPARESPLKISLLLSLIKFDRFEWCLEKATELGAAEIIPLNAARTDKALLSAAGKRMRRWEKILIESAQQSRRLKPPVLHSPLRAVDAFANCQSGWRVLLSESPDARPFDEIRHGREGNCAALAIGPEGGWTEEEITTARAAGFLEVSLGENILRTETATLAALALLRFALA